MPKLPFLVGYNVAMIRTVSGIVSDARLPEVIVEVGGIGYLVHTNLRPDMVVFGAPITFHTYLAVRETALDLYGFLNLDELRIFTELINLPKIGPKTALQILIQADINLIRESVRNDDPVHLSKLSGIGKKSAEKIVSGLRDRLEEEELGNFGQKTDLGTPTHTTDTIDALISLGYPATDARRVVIQITSEYPNVSTSAESLKLALKLLNSL